MSQAVAELRLHPGQSKVFKDPARYKVVAAGRRWGKTHLSRSFLLREAAKAKRGSLIWYIAPTYGMAKQIMWKDLLAAVPKRWLRHYHETEMRVELTNGVTIQCKGADDPDKLRGVGLAAVVLDEFQDMAPAVWWECVRPTLVTTGGRALIIGTPKAFNLLYELWLKGQDPESTEWRSWQFCTAESPFVPELEIISARRDTDPKTFRQEYEASFENMSGRVYYAFDRRTHIKECPFNPNLPIWVGQDFNIDPMSSCIMQPQLDGTIHVIDEIVLPGSNVEEVCAELSRRYWRYLNKITIYPDPSGKNRQHARGESSLDIFREHGFKRIKHRLKAPALQDRFNAVNKKLINAEGDVTFYVDPKCKHTIKSLEQVIYKEGTPEIDKSLGEEHITDALGYTIEYEFPLRKLNIAGISL